MICCNRLLLKKNNNVFSIYGLSIDEKQHFLADAEADIVRTGTDILRTDTDKMIFRIEDYEFGIQ